MKLLDWNTLLQFGGKIRESFLRTAMFDKDPEDYARTELVEDNQDLVRSLMKIPALNVLEEAEIKELLCLKEIQQFEPGERILQEGSLEGRIFYLISGQVKIAKRSKTLMTLRRVGDVFGEMGFLEGKACSASVYAVDAVVCLAIDVSDIARFSDISRLALHYLIYRELSEVLASRLNVTSKELSKAKSQLEGIRRTCGKS